MNNEKKLIFMFKNALLKKILEYFWNIYIYLLFIDSISCYTVYIAVSVVRSNESFWHVYRFTFQLSCSWN